MSTEEVEPPASHAQGPRPRPSCSKARLGGSYPILLKIRKDQNALQLGAYGRTKAQAGRRARFLILRLRQAEREAGAGLKWNPRGQYYFLLFISFLF